MRKSFIAGLIRSLLVFVFLLSGINASAQGPITVKLRLVDEKTSQPVPFATVSLTVKGETKASKYVLSDSEGVASLTKVKKGTYLLRAELMGYKTYEKEVAVEKNGCRAA